MTFLNNLQADSFYQASFGIVIEDSLSLASKLDSFSFSHVRWKGNAVADKLAKLVKNFDAPQVWSEDIPIEVDPLVLIDSSFAVVWIKFLIGFSQKKKKKHHTATLPINCHIIV